MAYRISVKGSSNRFYMEELDSSRKAEPYPQAYIMAKENKGGNIEVVTTMGASDGRPFPFSKIGGIPYTEFRDGNNEDATFASVQAVLDWFDDNTGFNSAGGSASSTVNVKSYGAKGDGTSNDFTAFTNALATGKNVDLELGKTYAISTLTTLTLAGDGQVLDGNGATLLVPNKWDNKAFLEITGNNVIVKNLNIIEASASPIDLDKNTSANVGLWVKGVNATIENVKIEGFGYPLMARDATADKLLISKCHFSKGVIWVEINSVRQVTIENSFAYNNGYDGWKVKNDFERTCDGFKMINCEGYSNGQRDTAAGGSESANGNGIDLYSGGNEVYITNSRFWGNYGSGVNIKGPTVDNQKQSEYYFTNVQSEGNFSTSGGTSSGFEVNTGFASASSLLHFVSCQANNNSGVGFYLLGGYGIQLNNCNVTNNGFIGISIATAVFDTTINQCNIFGNNGGSAGDLRIGNADDASFVSRRVNILNSVFSGNYDFNTGTSFDPKTATATVTGTNAIRVYSDTGDVNIVGNSFYNFSSESGTVMSRGAKVKFADNYVWNAKKAALVIYAGSATITNNHFDQTDFTSSVAAASIWTYSGSNTMIGKNKFTQSSLVASSYAIKVRTGTLGKVYRDQEYTNINKLSNGEPFYLEYSESGQYASAAPTTGTWLRGDVIYSTTPAASGTVGWVCVTAGTPGTWKAFGTIEP